MKNCKNMSKILKRVNRTSTYIQGKHEYLQKYRLNNLKQKFGTELEEVWPPKRNKRRNQKRANNKLVSSRACHVSGSKDLRPESISKDQKNNKSYEPEPMKYFPNLCGHMPKENYVRVLTREIYSSQSRLIDGNQSPKTSDTSRDSPTKTKSLVSFDTKHFDTDNIDNLSIFNIDSIADVDKLFSKDQQAQATELKEASVQLDRMSEVPKRIHISEIPRIKFIAENYIRYQKNDIELRKLKEKILCIEYDVFDVTDKGFNNQLTKDPYQVLRAFFSMKPRNENVVEGQEPRSFAKLPSYVKEKYQIADEDLKKLTEKEIQMIDGKIAENQPYLQDLKRVLRSKQIRKANDKPNLDLQYLYEMAQRDTQISDCKFSKLLTPNELEEVKDILQNRCLSSVHGIRRRIFKTRLHEDFMSQSTLLQEIDV